jgi:hypothetical protein
VCDKNRLGLLWVKTVPNVDIFHFRKEVCLFVLTVLGFELGLMITDALPLEPLCQPCFVLDFFEIESCKLFDWAGFKPRSF